MMTVAEYVKSVTERNGEIFNENDELVMVRFGTIYEAVEWAEFMQENGYTVRVLEPAEVPPDLRYYTFACHVK